MGSALKKHIILFLKGMAMGAADVVPGVSGGTIAFISGIYKELIDSISNINFGLIVTLKKEGFKAFWKKANANFLASILAGIFISALSVMHLMHYLLENHPIQIWSFFFGLVAASIIFVGKQIKKWSPLAVMLFIISAIGAFLITKMNIIDSSESLLYLFLCGAIAICAMILPGISGSFILVLLGAYSAISTAVHNMEIKKLLVFFIGCIVGVLSFSRLLKWLFSKYENTTLVILTGFILGSLNKIWPWKETLQSVTINEKVHIVKEASVLPQNYSEEPFVIVAIIFMIIGFVLILSLEKIAKRENA